MMLVPTPYSISTRDDDPYDIFEEIIPEYVDPDAVPPVQYPYYTE